ncbi:MAG TPA: hypothetical protein DEB39_12700 [Planctomycetaceae bacterium]|nr:hypothetical protein [Planctomycetaceae bacterium]
MSNNTWTASANEFAARIELDDLSGYFSKQLTVERGTRALVIDDGIYLGEVAAGTYTLKSFTDKLKFWRSAKRVDVILARQDDVAMTFEADKIPTAEELLVKIRVQLTVQIQDIALFARNLLGSRKSLSVDEMHAAVEPIIRQALREAVRQIGIAALCSPEVRPVLVTALREATQRSLLRYGIGCVDIQTAEIANEQYDSQRRKTGEIWLQDQSTTQQKALDQVLDRETLQKIERREREIELNVLAENAEIDAKEADVAMTMRRNAVRKNMREAINSELFNKATNREEFNAFLFEIDKQRLLRDDERHELENAFEAKKQDRDAARALLVRKLELQREAELDLLSATIGHARKVRSLHHEIELSKMVEDEENRKWRETLAGEIEKATLYFEEELKNLKRQQELTSKNAAFLRDEEWQQLLQRQKTARLAGEINEEAAARDVRVQRIQDEYAAEQKRRDYVLQKEMQLDQMQQLKAMEEMNRERERFESELLLNALSQKHGREIERLNTMGKMGVEALIASAQAENAALLANVQISKNESAAQTQLRDDAMRRERELMEQRIQDVQSGSAATLDTIQKITGQAFDAIGRGGGHATSGNVASGNAGSGNAAGAASHVTVCAGCRATNSPESRFCSNCGKQL